MGLIDVLTQYDTRKKAAHAAKTVKHGVRCSYRAGPVGGGGGGGVVVAPFVYLHYDFSS